MRCVPLFLFAFLVATPVLAEQPAAEKAKRVFEELKSLQGDWKIDSPERSTTVNYTLIANGSALVETWTMSSTRQSMTVYHLDGERLLATHYCPQGNAPRLEWVTADRSGAKHFSFLDGTNLQDPDGSHEHAFWIRIDDADRMTRNETYIGNLDKYDSSVNKGGSESFTRVK